MEDYSPSKIEEKWREFWMRKRLFSPDLDNAKKPFYNLMMFPYPSAEGLHVGNMYAFAGSDIYGRYTRMKGFDLFEPIGLDGFGIHSENYAIKVGRHPKEQAKISEKNFYRQLAATGNAYDWQRKLETYDPAYYKWTQWIFIQLFKAGVAYRKKSPVNFCSKDKTVLADEQVIDRKCERCGTLVEKRDLEQWFFKITKYADRLLVNIDKLDWSEKVKIAQRNWIGKKEGIEIDYQVEGQDEKITCFTTRPDTNFGATFIVLAPEHPQALKLTTKNRLRAVSAYIKSIQGKTDQDRIADGREKGGVFIGSYALNNLNGEKLPIWVSDFVLMEFGTGAVVGVPGHDKRDFEFAQKFKLPIKRVVVGKDGDNSPITKTDQVQEEEGTMINSSFLNGLDIHKATVKIMDYLEKKSWGRRQKTYHLRDWLISRQRYWGPPIPMVYCGKCGWQPVSEKDLPVLLPEVSDWRPNTSADGLSIKGPLANHPEFYKVACPNCGSEARRETDVSDTFLDSAWYFLRYTSGEVDNHAWDNKRVKKWLPVDMYIGGAEHSVLHLLYTRFLTMVFYDLGLIKFEEPFAKFRAHGLLIASGAKMSKSKGNIVNPDDYIAKYGADTLRCYLMFCGRFSQGGDFSAAGIGGISRFLNRVWRLVIGQLGYWAVRSAPKNLTIQEPISLHMMHRTIKSVTEDIESLDYNTAIAALMTWLNFLEKKAVAREEIETFLKLLAPFAPHITEELWSRLLGNWASRQLGKTRPKNLRAQRPNNRIYFQSIHNQPWPKYDPKLVESKKITLVVQVDGKLRDRIKAEKGLSQAMAKELALNSGRVKKYVIGKNYKVIYVEDRLINFVTASKS